MTIDTVTNANASGAGSLAQTLADATAGDTIEFAAGLSGGTISLASTLIITKNITIDGTANGAAITLSGNSTFTDVRVNAGDTVSLTGLDIIAGSATGTAGGGASGAGFRYSGNPGGAAGGGIYDAGTLTLSNVALNNDSATGGAGGTGTAPGSPGLYYSAGGAGGSAAGGVYVAGGAVLNVGASVTFSSDSATGGAGGRGGYSRAQVYTGGAGGAGGSQSSGGSATAPGSGASGNGSSHAPGAGGAAHTQGGYGGEYFPGRYGSGGGGGGGFAYANDGGQGTINTIACFAQGTRIRAPNGDVAVEALRAGDLVMTPRGTTTVRWVGHRDSDCARHPSPADLWPIRVAAGAFAPGLPSRDLFLSPGHAVFVGDGGGALIPIRHLVNGATIAQLTVPRISYFHVECDAHEVLFADDLPAESYLDDGNRAAFANGGELAQLHPNFAETVWSERARFPLYKHGALVLAVRRRLLERAAALGWSRSDFPALRLMCDGRALVQLHDSAGVEARLPPGAETVRIQSRASVPPHLDGDALDSRALGILVTSLKLDGEPVALDDARVDGGWHAAEPAGRWTDGDAGVRCGGATSLRISFALAPQYWLAPADPAAARRVA